jgi:hypothetical protein
MSTPPIVLVPGFWLGAWAWDDVAAALRADGRDVTALTLPGRESPDTDRSSITLVDHVDAIIEAVTAAGRAVVLREGPELSNDARLDIPSTVVATGYTSAEYKEAAKEGSSWLDGLNELRNVTWIDLPTSHWPMWSRPQELAEIIGGIAKGASEP